MIITCRLHIRKVSEIRSRPITFRLHRRVCLIFANVFLLNPQFLQRLEVVRIEADWHRYEIKPFCHQFGRRLRPYNRDTTRDESSFEL